MSTPSFTATSGRRITLSFDDCGVRRFFPRTILGDAVDHADPAMSIRKAAVRFGADAICLGSHGRSGLSAVLVGSVTHAVMAHTLRPVLVVRSPAE